MKIITEHKTWWLCLIAGTLAVSLITTKSFTVMGFLSSIVGHLGFAIMVALIPWAVYLLLKKPLTTEQMMATITMGWLILAVANLSVM